MENLEPWPHLLAYPVVVENPTSVLHVVHTDILTEYRMVLSHHISLKCRALHQDLASY